MKGETTKTEKKVTAKKVTKATESKKTGDTLFEMNQKMIALNLLIEEINKELPLMTSHEQVANDMQNKLYELSRLRASLMKKMQEILLNEE